MYYRNRLAIAILIRMLYKVEGSRSLLFGFFFCSIILQMLKKFDDMKYVVSSICMTGLL